MFFQQEFCFIPSLSQQAAPSPDAGWLVNLRPGTVTGSTAGSLVSGLDVPKTKPGVFLLDRML